MDNKEMWDVPFEERERYIRKLMLSVMLVGFMFVGYLMAEILYFLPKSAECVTSTQAVDIISSPPLVIEIPAVAEVSTAHLTYADTPPDEPEEEEIVFYNIPLSDDFQKYTQELCEAYGVYYPLALATMQEESQFDLNAISPINNNGTRDWGIMQINEDNHEWLMDELGVTDIMDPHQNILCGVFILSIYSYRFDDDYQTISMWYNWPSKAKEYGAVGKFTPYSERVMGYMVDIESRVRVVLS